MSQHHRWDDSLVPGPPLVVPGARARIRESNLSVGRRLLVIDDDPTGSQTVHHVEAVLTVDLDLVARALAAPGSTCFVLTNSRSLDEDAAFEVNRLLGEAAARLEQTLGGCVEVVSRSDSTLRGHLRAEITALSEARTRICGRDYDGVLVVPSYFEAGRFTAGDVHWATVGGQPLAAGETEFARDRTFGYRSSNLAAFVVEKYAGDLTDENILRLTLDDIRSGGRDRIASLLTDLPPEGRTHVVVNATDYADLDVVVLGVQAAEATGRTFLFRSGPSLVQSLAGLEPASPLSVVPDAHRGGHGLLVVGSHVGLTTQQVEHLIGHVHPEVVLVEAADLAGPDAETTIARAVEDVVGGLARGEVLLMTSRTVVAGDDPASSLAIARRVSSGLVAITDRVAARVPLPWVVAKGGITSHDILSKALRIERAEVMGQLFPGAVSVFRPIDARPEIVGTPCVVFAGNVGDEQSLTTTVLALRG